jgi:hypothetical protein
MKESKRLKRMRQPKGRMLSVSGQATEKVDATTDLTTSERPLHDYVAEVSENTAKTCRISATGSGATLNECAKADKQRENAGGGRQEPAGDGKDMSVTTGISPFTKPAS